MGFDSNKLFSSQYASYYYSRYSTSQAMHHNELRCPDAAVLLNLYEDLNNKRKIK